MKRYNEDQAFEDVALIYAGFECSKCFAYLHDSDEEKMVQEAKELGWLVKEKDDDWQVLCPKCKE